LTTKVVTTSVEADLDPARDGELRAENDAIIVRVPSGAQNVPVRVRFERATTKVSQDDRYPQPVVNRFSLRAFERADARNEIKQFRKPLTLTVRYDPQTLRGWRAQDLAVVYWDTTKKQWIVLPSRVDTSRRVVIAQTTHFTDFGLTTAPDIQAYLPSLSGVQPNLFNGAASAGYDIEVPAGRNGLTPKLSVSYSSAGVEMMDENRQASFVGAGWSLSASYIARDTRSTLESSDDVFSLVLNGAGYDLARDAANANLFHTTAEQFWRITFDATNDRWEVTTTDGTRYQYGYAANSRARQWRRTLAPDGSFISTSQETYAWHLEKVVDTHDNEIAFTYRHDTNTADCGDGIARAYDDALYPQFIRYNKTGAEYLTEIAFSYSARADYVFHATNTQCATPLQHSKLDRIDVRTKMDGALQLARAYTFEYDYATFPGVLNSSGQFGRLTLKKITRRGNDNVSTLPPYTLTYRDNRLWQVANGIGGKASFDYGEFTFSETNALRGAMSWDFRGCALPNGLPCSQDVEQGTAASVGAGVLGDVSAAYIATTGAQYAVLKAKQFTPGVYYRFHSYITLGSEFYPGRFKLVAWDGATNTETVIKDWTTLTPCTSCDYGGTFKLPHTAKTLQIRVYVENSIAAITLAWLELVPTYYRVTTRTLEDGQAQPPAAYTYAYVGAALNNPTNSSSYRAPAYTQLRGHSKVTVTDPTGAKTENYFYQDDVFQGRTREMVQLDANNIKYTRVVNTFDKRCSAVEEYTGPYDSRNSCTLAPIKTGPTPTPTPIPPPPTPTATPTDLRRSSSTGLTHLAYAPQSAPESFAPGTELPAAPPSIAPAQSQAPMPVTGEKAYFVFLAQTLRETYDAQATALAVKTAYDYDSYGNLKQTDEYRNLTELYRRTTRNFYAPNSRWVTNRVQREEIFDAGSAALSKTEYAYDNAPTPDRGDLTSLVVWKDSTNFFTREWNAYDAYGNRTSATDALSRTTTIQYDSVYNVFPASVTNALNHTTTTTYDYRFGKPARVIDPNNAATSYQYDAFGRTEKIWLPLEHTANPDTKYDPTVRYTYTLGNPRSTAKVEVRNDLGGANAATYQPAWWFFDGLGRTIQQQTQSATSGQTIFANTAYTARGEVWRVSNPYTLTVASGAYQNPDWTKPSTTHDYDPIGRAIKTTNPDATFQTIAYNQWTTTFTDANGHKRETIADAFGRVIEVREYTGAQTYTLYATTNYQYDTLNRLRFVTDAATNQTEMRYDWLGRKTWMSDPDLGAWSYGYDDARNKKTSAKARRSCLSQRNDPTIQLHNL
jgi:YD repeat-containing protein